MSDQPTYGKIGWLDLTVDDATGVRDFYSAVAGWSHAAQSMGEYDDFVMQDAAGNPVGGICHARGDNAGMPAQWLNYVTVPDLAASCREAAARGGAVVQGPRELGSYGTLAIVRDPAGAHLALLQPPA